MALTIEEINERVESWQTEITTLREQLAATVADLSKLSEKLQDNPDHRALATEVKDLRTLMEAQESRLAEAKQELSEAKKQLAHLKATQSPAPEPEGGTKKSAPVPSAKKDEPAERPTESEGEQSRDNPRLKRAGGFR